MHIQVYRMHADIRKQYLPCSPNRDQPSEPPRGPVELKGNRVEFLLIGLAICKWAHMMVTCYYKTFATGHWAIGHDTLLRPGDNELTLQLAMAACMSSACLQIVTTKCWSSFIAVSNQDNRLFMHYVPQLSDKDRQSRWNSIQTYMWLSDRDWLSCWDRIYRPTCDWTSIIYVDDNIDDSRSVTWKYSNIPTSLIQKIMWISAATCNGATRIVFPSHQMWSKIVSVLNSFQDSCSVRTMSI